MYIRQRTKYNWDGLVSLNIVRIVYGVFTIAIALQQFEVTEPMTLGVFYLTLLTMIIGEAAWVRYHHQTVRGVRAFLIVQVIGILVQIGIFVFLWDWLVIIDNFLHGIRDALGQGDPYIVMRLIWAAVTLLMIIYIAHPSQRCLIKWPHTWRLKRW